MIPLGGKTIKCMERAGAPPILKNVHCIPEAFSEVFSHATDTFPGVAMNDQGFGASPEFVRMGRRPRLLVVDDDPVNLQVIGSYFEEDHDVTLVGSAALALELCREELPDLLLLDIVMPDLDGLETCRRLKADPLTRELPVIFVTAQATPQEETDALNVGAVDCITKPVNPAVVRARVRTHLTLKAQADFLRSLAFLDGLTGVANRRRFDEFMDAEWRRSRRSGATMALIMVDIDNFKHYNDTYGHLAGDVCLQAVARALNGALKRAQDLMARYGGEEFACVLPETDLVGGRRLAETLLEAVRDLAIPHDGVPPGSVTISLGVASQVPEREAAPENLLAKADARLYEAKAGGRNRVEG